jgi:hypothetical protein
MRYTIYSLGGFSDEIYRGEVVRPVGGLARMIVDTGASRVCEEYDRAHLLGRRHGGRPQDELIGEGLVLWNGLIPAYRRVADAARARGMWVAFVEGGPVRGTYQVDPDGTNGACSVTPLGPEAFAGLPADESVYDDVFTPRQVVDPTHRDPLPADEGELPPGRVVLQMQTHGDTQLTHFSPFQTMPDFMAAALAAIPRGIPVVASEHPWERNRAHYDELRAKYPQVIWCRTRDVASLLEGAAACITINGTVGYQALVKRVPVLAFGTGFYVKPGLVARPCDYHGRSRAALRAAIAGTATDADLRTRFLTWVRDHWAVKHGTGAFARRVHEIAAHRRPWLEVLA